MTYDLSLRRVILFSGSSISSVPGEVWEWDGTNWVLRILIPGPRERRWHALAYDTARQRTVMFGGQLLSGYLVTLADTWLYGTVVSAAGQPIGNACAGSNGPPAIAAGPPFHGNASLVLDLVSARASAPCVFGLASGTQTLSLGGGCSFYLSGWILPLVTASNGSGFASVRLAVPLDTTLRGGIAYGQAFVLDPMGGFAGLSFSGGLRLLIGD